ncbi:MAG: c-type cytochrome [Burkholderiales bacterium]
MRSIVVGGLLALLGVPAMASDPRISLKPEPLGRVIYQQHCATCHGARGEGAPGWQQPDKQGELPAPPHNSEGHTWKHSDAMLYRIVKQGWHDPFNKTDRLTMPAYAGQLSPREIEAVITYLKTLWMPEQRRFQRKESRLQPFPSETH